MSTSRSTAAVSCFEMSDSAAARFVARKVFPTPPLVANTEMIDPRCCGTAAICPLMVVTFSVHWMARSTASRSSSLPLVRSTTSRIPARMAVGRNPFEAFSWTAMIAVIGAVRPTNSARPSASSSFTSGESTSTRAVWSVCSARISSAAMTLCTQPTSSGSTSIDLASAARKDCRSHGDHVLLCHVSTWA